MTPAATTYSFIHNRVWGIRSSANWIPPNVQKDSSSTQDPIALAYICANASEFPEAFSSTQTGNGVSFDIHVDIPPQTDLDIRAMCVGIGWNSFTYTVDVGITCDT